MANWAIVVGINEYKIPNANLTGAVNDALEMAKWLVSETGGNVPANKLLLLTHPKPDASLLPKGIKYLFNADADNLIEAINQLVSMSGKKGERLFFYFSGHGLTNFENFVDEPAIVMADFDNVKTDKAIALSSIFDYFSALQYKEQFFIIDACRNILDWKKKFRVGQLPTVEEIDPNKSIVSQYKLFATSPRTKAVDLGEHGAFTKALLDGLKGEGTAKVYDEEGEKYIVSVDRLFKYVEKKVLERKLNVSKDENSPIYQQPRIVVDGNLEFPCLAELALSQVSNQQLSIDIKTTSIPSNAELVLFSQNGEVSEAVSPIESKVVTLADLKPMRYTVKVTAPNYTSNPKRKSVELYEPQKIEVALERKISPSKITSVDSVTDYIDQPVTKSMGHTDILFNKPANKFIKPAISLKTYDLSEAKDEEIDEVKDENIEIDNPKLTIRSADPTLPLKVIDSKGIVLGYDTEKIVLSDIETASYYACLFTPEDKMTQQLIDWDKESDTVKLVAPFEPYTSLTKRIIEKIGLKVHKDSTVELSEKLPYVASVKLSTILAFAAVAKNFPSLGWGSRLAKLGLKSFSEITKSPSESGLHIIVATEFVEEKETADYLANINTRLWKIDKPVTKASTFTALQELPSIAELAFAADAGAYYLSIEIKEERPVIFQLNLFKDRLTILVIHQHLDGKFQAFQYCPDTKANDLQNPILMRRLEVLQRASLNNTKTHTEKNVSKLVEEKWQDPIALCLNAYLLLYLKKTEEVKPIVDGLIKTLPALPDSHILHAEYLQRTKNEEKAKEAYRKALDLGLPVFLEGLEMLYFYVKKAKLEHPQVDFLNKVYERRVKNALWTIWEPGTDNLTPGKRIEDQIGDSTTLVINTQNITATGRSSIHNAVQVQGSNVINALIVGDNNKVFVGDYTRLKDAYINPWPVFERVNLEQFVGRDWIVSEVDEFLNKYDRGYFILEAEAGLGKTTFLAHLAKTRNYIHLFAELAEGQEGIGASIKNLAAQIVLSAGLEAEEAEGVLPGNAVRPEFLSNLLKRASEKREGRKIVLVVDALDQSGSLSNQNVMGLPKVLPEGVYIIASQRPVAVALNVDVASTSKKVFPVKAESEANLDDMRRFLEKAAVWPEVIKALEHKQYTTEDFVETLLDKCRGVWIYLHYVVAEIKSGQRSPLELEDLPNGMTQYYIQYWNRWREEDEEKWYQVYLPVLTCLAVAQEAVTTETISSWSEVKWERALTRLLNEEWRPFLIIAGEGQNETYRFYHATLREFFSGQADRKNLSDSCWSKTLFSSFLIADSERPVRAFK